MYFIELTFLFYLTLAVFDLFFMIQLSRGVDIVLIVAAQVITGGVGWIKLRKMDPNLLFFIDTELKKGGTIVPELWEEFVVLSAFYLLIVPGFFSDIMGGVLLIPQIRELVMELFFP